MSKNRKQENQKLVWIFIFISVILALALWIWPTYIASPPVSSEIGSTFSQQQIGHIDVEGAYQKHQDGAFMLDVRTAEEWQEGYIPGATLIPLDQLSARYGELPANKEIVIYCRSGNRSGQALSLLTEVGFSDIYSMDGGINDWISAGYEIKMRE